MGAQASRGGEGGTPSRAEKGEQTRREILAGAARVFAEKGFSGSSYRELAEASGNSKALVYHHYGSKEKLYEAVRGDFLRRYLEALEKPLGDSTDLEEFLFEGLRRRFLFYRDHPDVLRVATWAWVEGIDREPLGAGEMRARVARRMEEARRRGYLRKDVTIPFLAAMIGGMITFWLQYRERYSEGLGEDAGDADERYFREMVTLLARGAGTKKFRDLVERRFRGL